MRIKKHLKSVICLVLAMLMVFSIVFVVNAAEESIASTGAAKTVYFKNTGNWSTVNAYVWVEGTENSVKAWPGEAMTLHEGNIYKYTVNGDYNMIIFNNGSGSKTLDLTLGADGELYDYSTSAWEAYAGSTPTGPTTTPTTAPTTTPTTAPTPGNGGYVYCENAAGWSSVSVYMWKGGSANGSWPGKAMTNIGDNIWRYEVTGDYSEVIFNNGSSTQTGNLTYPGANYIFNNSTNQWSVYDTSPITVKSYGTDVESPQYKGMDITLSASAVSTGGIVYYKFSVTNSSGSTTVIKDFSTASKAAWCPTTAGTYTLTYEFKDGSQNTNKRTAEFTVIDDTGIEEPIIKKVSPAPGEVKYNTNMNISVTASGGNVGTKLLFYKYTVKDANGNIINVPYYSKSSTYTYKPTTQGKFTVTVSLQNSSNKTIERTFTYDSVLSITPTDPTETLPTDPTTPTTPGPLGVLGDADGDGILSVMDATQIQRYAAQLITSSEIRLDLSDYDKDGIITVIDATAIQQKLAGIN